MGNCSGKQKYALKSPIHHSGRRKVYQAQDQFVRNLVTEGDGNVDVPDGTAGANDGDEDSIGPERTRLSSNPDWNCDDLVPLDMTLGPQRRPILSSVLSHDEFGTQVDSKAQQVNINDYDFHFENLIFEGGGNKGLAYCGAVRVLEDLGVYHKVKRYAGSSAGAMTASLLAVGYNSHEIEEFLSQDLSKIFLDHSCGIMSLLPNLLQGYGWNPGKKIFQWFGEALGAKTGNADITFKEIYERFGKELCVVVTNLNMMTAEYFHPKTSPDMPVRMAVRMSMAIPGLFQASRYEIQGEQNTYVDGGVLCNYPINCYDGWWLSMKMEDSFLNRLQPLENFPKLFEKKERFGTYNANTLGFLLYADNERDILRDILQQRVGSELPAFPDTKLAKEKAKKKKIQDKVKKDYIKNLHAVSAFLKVLKKHNKNNDDKIDKAELTNALNDKNEFPTRYAVRLFGRDVTVDQAMEALDEDKNGEIYFHEIVRFIERNGVSLQSRFLGYQRKEIKGLFSFFDTLQSALLTNVKRIFVEERDIDRTVGINTGHVGTSDFVLEQEDRNFVVNQGRRSTEAFLKYYVVREGLPKKGRETDEQQAKPFNGHANSGIGRPQEFSSMKVSAEMNMSQSSQDDPTLEKGDFDTSHIPLIGVKVS
ncbi:uncharacterized protein LOC127856622 isoform X3 [Dreissena polymorpha]|uniref:uncharacterized protein LOC127856622 isoform X3 n=1 Tax=Dreissena polymorpha TaxID=45954 RepID=UPI00226438A1|nr:uncharacterized protein LOC127856622 isoform X3 [Dreissena polymorpha]